MTYKYYCSTCKKTTEIKASMNKIAELKPACTKCGTELTRQYTAPPVHYKGTGFYTTDYKGK